MIRNKIKKKAIFFFHENPYPFVNGNQKRALEIIKALISKGLEVHFFSMNFLGSRWDDESREVLIKIGVRSVRVYEILCWEKRFMKWLARRKKPNLLSPELPVTFTNPPFLKLWFWKEILRISPDMLWINYAFMGNLVDVTGGNVLKVIEMHDLVSANSWMRRLLGLNWKDSQFISKQMFLGMNDELWDERAWAKKAVMSDEREYEVYDKFDYVVSIAESEAALVRSHTGKTKVILAAHSITPSETGNDYSGPIFFPAGKHIFNIHGYLYFVKKIWPLIRLKNRNAEIQISGNLKDLIFEDDGVKFLDYMPDLDEIYQKSAFAICPLISGTGQPVKVIESLARGLAVIATKHAAKDTPLIHGENGFIAETPEEFAEYAHLLWNDRDRCKVLGVNARETVRKIFEGASFEKRIEPIINSLLTGNFK